MPRGEPSNDEMTSVQSLAELNGLIQQVRHATRYLDEVEQITALLKYLAETLKKEADVILEANTLDLEASLEMALPELIVEWLKLTPERLKAAITSVERLTYTGASPLPSCYTDIAAIPTASTYCMGKPLGVIALIYEALPELAIVAAALCVRSGNGLILKGGHEASQTNQAIADIFQTVLAKVGLPPQTILAVSPSEGEAARRWLMQTSDLDLVIPYGRNSLVQRVVQEANSPSLTMAIGNCFLYWADTVPADFAAKLVIDSQKGIPEAVNGIEKVLVDSRIAPEKCQEFQDYLKAADLVPYDLLRSPFEMQETVAKERWQHAQLDRSVLLCRVSDVSEAIALVNQYSYGHADGIATNSYQESVQFVRRVKSASIYVNTSPRFNRNGTQANGISLGMSPQGAEGGRVGINTLLTRKFVIQGFRP